MADRHKHFGEMILENPALIGGMLGFAFLGFVIVSNAAFFQQERHPSPIFDGTFVNHQPQSTTSPMPVPRIQPLLVEQIQQELTARGYYGGEVDGRIGPKTRTAILAFQRAQNRAPTGVVTRQLLAQIRTSDGRLLPTDETLPGQTASIESAESAQPALTQEDRVMRVQAALDRLGYGPVQIDGKSGAQTISAIKGFQLDHGMIPDGQITDNLVTRIEIFGGTDLNQ